jgi:uncharacterized membrane protein YhaH (DUF805 family)
MTFFAAIQNGFRRYAEFPGRASRSEFWWWILFVALVNAALSAVWPVRAANGFVTLGTTATTLWGLATLLPTLAVLVRRLRDAGYGWGHVFWALVPIAGLVVLAVLCAQPPREPVAPLPAVTSPRGVQQT